MEIQELSSEDISKGRIILYFYKDGCPPCEKMKPQIQAMAEALEWKVYKVKTTVQQDICAKYNITSTPTFIYIVDGEICHVQIGSCMNNCLSEIKCDENSIQFITERDYEDKILKSKEPIVLEFVRTGCSNCKAMEDKVKEFSKTNKIYKVNPTINFQKKFNLNTAPTFIGFKDGKELGRASGIIPSIGLVLQNGAKFADFPLADLKALAYDIQEELKRRQNGN